jgi:hypothetical protein
MHENSLSTPFLESNWNRVGAVGKFRTYGTAANEEVQLLSDIHIILKDTS